MRTNAGAVSRTIIEIWRIWRRGRKFVFIRTNRRKCHRSDESRENEGGERKNFDHVGRCLSLVGQGLWKRIKRLEKHLILPNFHVGIFGHLLFKVRTFDPYCVKSTFCYVFLTIVVFKS